MGAIGHRRAWDPNLNGRQSGLLSITSSLHPMLEVHLSHTVTKNRASTGLRLREPTPTNKGVNHITKVEIDRPSNSHAS